MAKKPYELKPGVTGVTEPDPKKWEGNHFYPQKAEPLAESKYASTRRPVKKQSLYEGSLDVVDVELEALPPYLMYDPTLDPELSPRAADEFKTILEAVSKADSKVGRLLEARWLKEASARDIVRDYISARSGEDLSYEDLKSFVADAGISEDVVPSLANYQAVIRDFRKGVMSPGKGAAKAGKPVEEEDDDDPIEDYDEETADEDVKQLVQLYNAPIDGETEAQAGNEIEKKFNAIYKTVYRTSIGRATKRHAFICGSAGIGKTYCLLQAVERASQETGQELHKYRGSIGKALSSVLAFLWKHQYENHIVLLDDCDGFLTESNDEVINTLKAALDTDDPVVSTGSMQVRLNAGRQADYREDEDGDEYFENNIHFDTSRVMREGIVEVYKGNKVIASEYLTEDSEFNFWCDLHEAIEEGNRGRKMLSEARFYEAGEEGAKTSPLPEKFKFMGKLIFVSNLRRAKVPEAIASRTNIKELYLTRAQILERLQQILPNIMKNQTAYTAEELDWAKANAFRWLKACVAARNTSAPLVIGGKPARVEINVAITFRMFNDFVDGWMSVADDYFDSHPEASIEECEKAVVMEFVSQEILPQLAGDQR